MEILLTFLYNIWYYMMLFNRFFVLSFSFKKQPSFLSFSFFSSNDDSYICVFSWNNNSTHSHTYVRTSNIHSTADCASESIQYVCTRIRVFTIKLYVKIFPIFPLLPLHVFLHNRISIKNAFAATPLENNFSFLYEHIHIYLYTFFFRGTAFNVF